MKYSFLLLSVVLFLSLGSCGQQGLRLSKKEVLPETFDLVILSTTDVHGHIMPWDYFRDQPDTRTGLLKAATLIDSVRAANPYTILVDNGDWLQGSPMSEFFAMVDTVSPNPFLQAAAYLQYDAINLGNHEFDYSLRLINNRISESTVPVLSANMLNARSGEPYYKPYIFKSFGKLKIGILGLITPGTAVWSKARLDGEIIMEDPVAIAKKYVPEMIRKGADIIIVLAHSGLEGASSYVSDNALEENFGKNLGNQVAGIDYIILGHHHSILENQHLLNPEGKKTGFIMPGSRGSHLGISTLTVNYNKSLKKWQVTDQKSKAVPVLNAKTHLGLNDLLLDAHIKVRGYYNQAIATTGAQWSTANARLEDTPVIDLIQYIQHQKTGAQLSAATAFNTQTAFGPGDITLGDMAQLYPYENKLSLIEISGVQLKAYLEHSSRFFEQTETGMPPRINRQWPGFNYDMISGVDYVLDISVPVGQRVKSLSYKGSPVKETDVFTFVVNSYRAAGGGGFDMLKDAKVLKEYDISVRELIAGFLKQKGAIEPSEVFVKNWRLEN
jgi:2',3'-cyclic-nucleotide 2'-phosphodiesterase (5'-nucleotidase family)